MSVLKIDDITDATPYTQMSLEEYMEELSKEAVMKAAVKEEEKEESEEPECPFQPEPDITISFEDSSKSPKESYIQKNIKLIARFMKGDANAFGEYLDANKRLISRIAAETKWQRYALVELDDVLQVIYTQKLLALTDLIKKGYQMNCSADFYKLKLETTSRTKRVLTEDYSDTGCAPSYSSYKRKTRTEDSLNEMKKYVSSEKYEDSEETGVINVVDTDAQISVLDDLIIQENQKCIYNALESMNEQERAIIAKRFGLYGLKRETREQVAQDLALTKNQVRSIELRVLRSLRVVLA